LRQFIPDLETNDLIKIYSNVMDFDENGVFKGFELPHIHSLHKENVIIIETGP
jgi:Pyrimidine 5''-nucleotidase (UMPH-1).